MRKGSYSIYWQMSGFCFGKAAFRNDAYALILIYYILVIALFNVLYVFNHPN